MLFFEREACRVDQSSHIHLSETENRSPHSQAAFALSETVSRAVAVFSAAAILRTPLRHLKELKELLFLAPTRGLR